MLYCFAGFLDTNTKDNYLLLLKTKQNTNLYKHTKAFGKGDYKGGKPTARFSPFVLFCFPFFAKKEKGLY